jgi:hypothetical protein
LYSAYPALLGGSKNGEQDNTADRQRQWALTQSTTANQNKKLTHCHSWGSNLPPSAHYHTSLNAQPSHTPITTLNFCFQFDWCFDAGEQALDISVITFPQAPPSILVLGKAHFDFSRHFYFIL